MYKNKFTKLKGKSRNYRRKSRRNPLNRQLIEVKHYDYYFANTNAYLLPLFTAATYVDDAFEQDTTGAGAGFACVNQIVQGVLGINRVGIAYHIKSFDVKMSYKLVGTNKYNSVRTLLVQDKFPNGVAPVLSDILISLGIGTALNFESFQNIYHTKRFKILKDKVYDMDSDFKDQINIKWHISTDISVQCQASNGNIADISSGAIYLIAGSQEYAGAAGITTSINCAIVSCRTTFFDI